MYSEQEQENFKIRLRAMRLRVQRKRERFLNFVLKRGRDQGQVSPVDTNTSGGYFGQIESETVNADAMFEGLRDSTRARIEKNSKCSACQKKRPRKTKSRCSVSEFHHYGGIKVWYLWNWSAREKKIIFFFMEPIYFYVVFIF